MAVAQLYEIIIVGGGPAGLNAAVVLGRCRRKVLVFDTGNQRNKASQGIHNFLTRDDILPVDFINIARKEVTKYGVSIKKAEITSARKTNTGEFLLKDRNGRLYRCKNLVIATGLKDKLPGIKDLHRYYGSSIFHCPYCDGWEVRDKRIAVFSENKTTVDLALSLKTWSKDVSFFTNGHVHLRSSDKQLLRSYNIPIITEKIMGLEGRNGKLQSIRLQGKPPIRCDAIFIASDFSQHSRLATELGCTLNRKKVVITRKSGRANVPGLYVVGDASWDMHLVVIAAAEGAKAGVYINKQLQKEEKRVIVTTKKILD